MASSIGITLQVQSQQLIQELRKATDAFKSFADTAQSSGNRAAQGLDKVDTKANAVAGSIGRLKSVLAGAAFLGFAQSAINSADAIVDLSKATGLAINDIAGLGKFMGQMGGSAADADKAVLTLFQNIDEARQGSESAQTAFGRLGISLSDLTKSDSELFKLTLQRLAGVKNEAEQTALKAELLGKSFRGVEINEGNIDTLIALQAEQEKYNESAIAAAELSDKMAESFGKLKTAFLIAFEPIISGISKLTADMPTLITAFKVLGAVIIGVFAVSGITAFARVLGGVLTGLRAAGSLIGKLFGKGGKEVVDATGKAMSTGQKVTTAVAVAGGVVAAGGAASALFSEGKEDDKTAKKSEENAKKKVTAANKVIDAFNKQKTAIRSITEAYELSTKQAVDRIREDTAQLQMSDKQKDAARARAEVEKEAEKQIANLNSKRIEGNKGVNAVIDAEIEKIKQRRDATLPALDAEIEKKYEVLRLDNERVKAMESMFEIQNKVKDIQDSYLLDSLTGIEKQLKQIEVQERRTMEAALQRFDVENRKLPPSEFAARREAEYQRLNAVFDETVKKQQEAAKEGYAQARTFESGWTKAFKEYTDNATNAAAAAQRVFQKATQGMEDLIINFAKTGKFEFKGFMNSILEELLRSQVRSLMAQIFNLSGKSSTNAGGLLGGSIIPGFLAQGGNAQAGLPYVVGENGPEMFVPNQSGTVIPNNQMAAASTYVTYNINAVDAMSFKQMVAADPSFIYAVSQQGAKSIPQTRR